MQVANSICKISRYTLLEKLGCPYAGLFKQKKTIEYTLESMKGKSLKVKIGIVKENFNGPGGFVG